jgi:hypothetical protein
MANGYDGRIHYYDTDIIWIEPKIYHFYYEPEKEPVRRGLTNKKYLEMTRMR